MDRSSPDAALAALQRMQTFQYFVVAFETGAATLETSACANSARLCSLIKALATEELITVIDNIKTADGEPRSIALYRLWLDLTDSKKDQTFAVWYNLGVQLSAAGETQPAIRAFQTAKTHKPDLYQAAVNMGLAYETLGQTDLALKIWQDALQSDEARLLLLNHTARLLEILKRYDEAQQALRASLLTNPHQPDTLHHWLGLRAKTCTWPLYEDTIAHLDPNAMVEATGALTLLAVADDIDLQSRLNEAYIDRKFPKAPNRLSPETGYRHAKLKIGYLSSDYCMHPMAYLVTELFECHDRSRFEIIGFCSTKDDGSAERKRLLAAFDACVFIRDLSDEAAATTIASHAIDILVDLNGLTLGSRLGVLRWRPAPVQITYLGYNGPMPMPELDYILADSFVVPPQDAHRYRPTPLYLPGCYQSNDSRQPVAAVGTRADAGLPPDSFVFCCFSNNYKITEDMFAAWMTILRTVDASVLWLYADNRIALQNMQAKAARAGIAPERLIFASRVNPALYRARLALADLFLDTYPYNAGTTASDALRAGLPIITVAGQTFIARMAGSLLRAIGLPETIVTTLDAYVDLAIDLATNKPRYASIRRTVGGDAWRRTLGDTPAFLKGLEAVYESIAVKAE